MILQCRFSPPSETQCYINHTCTLSRFHFINIFSNEELMSRMVPLYSRATLQASSLDLKGFHSCHLVHNGEIAKFQWKSRPLGSLFPFVCFLTLVWIWKCLNCLGYMIPSGKPCLYHYMCLHVYYSQYRVIMLSSLASDTWIIARKPDYMFVTPETKSKLIILFHSIFSVSYT